MFFNAFSSIDNFRQQQLNGNLYIYYKVIPIKLLRHIAFYLLESRGICRRIYMRQMQCIVWALTSHQQG